MIDLASFLVSRQSLKPDESGTNAPLRKGHPADEGGQSTTGKGQGLKVRDQRSGVRCPYLGYSVA